MGLREKTLALMVTTFMLLVLLSSFCLVRAAEKLPGLKIDLSPSGGASDCHKTRDGWSLDKKAYEQGNPALVNPKLGASLDIEHTYVEACVCKVMTIRNKQIIVVFNGPQGTSIMNDVFSAYVFDLNTKEAFPFPLEAGYGFAGKPETYEWSNWSFDDKFIYAALLDGTAIEKIPFE